MSILSSLVSPFNKIIKNLKKGTKMTHPANFDFFAILPAEINEIVWDLLPNKDLLNATLTCKLWNELIGKSDSFKKRIVINVSDLEKDKQIFNFSKSKRSYETVNIRRYKNSSDLNNLSSQEWKKVFFNIAKIKSQSKFIDIFKDDFPFVKELKIMNVSIKELSKNASISLPCLELLVFSDISLDVFDMFINHHPKLKSLSLRFVYKDIGHESTVGAQLERVLLLNHQLQNLEIYEDITNDFFARGSTQQLKLSLKSFAVGLNNSSDEVHDNLVKFLNLNGDTLQDLRVMFHQKTERQEGHHWGYWARQGGEEDIRDSKDLLIILKAWNQLKALEKLTLHFLKSSENLDDADVFKGLQANSNIKEINIKHINYEIPHDALQNLVRFAPSIRSVYISHLKFKFLRLLSTKFTLLRSIKFATEEGDCRKEYNDMIAANKCDNKFIKLSKAILG